MGRTESSSSVICFAAKGMYCGGSSTARGPSIFYLSRNLYLIWVCWLEYEGLHLMFRLFLVSGWYILTTNNHLSSALAIDWDAVL